MIIFVSLEPLRGDKLEGKRGWKEEEEGKGGEEGGEGWWKMGGNGLFGIFFDEKLEDKEKKKKKTFGRHSCWRQRTSSVSTPAKISRATWKKEGKKERKKKGKGIENESKTEENSQQPKERNLICVDFFKIFFLWPSGIIISYLAPG